MYMKTPPEPGTSEGKAINSVRFILVFSGLGGMALAFGQPHDWLWLLSGVVMPGVSFVLAAGFPYFSRRAAGLKGIIRQRLCTRR